MGLVHEEEGVRDLLEPVFVERLAKLLIMIVPNYSIRMCFGLLIIVGGGIRLVSWKSNFAVSAIEALAEKKGRQPCFSCSLPSTWVKSLENFGKFNSTPYVSPYSDPRALAEHSDEMEKRTVGFMHEFLSLTLGKKSSIVKLGHFSREFCLPEKLNVLLLKHPGIFYVSNKYRVYTVILKEGYKGSELIEKDPLVLVKEKFGDLMQEGLHEYNRRHYKNNLEKKRLKGMVKSGRNKDESTEICEQDDSNGVQQGGLFNPEERKRFYNVLFDDWP
ncbi:hypothetical protein ACFE04_003721 [Oxalis oulophora]